MAQKPPFAPGLVMGAFEILALLRDAPDSRKRIYRVRALCCGQVVERTSHSLKSSERAESGRCKTCGINHRPAAAPRPSGKYPVGLVVGPVTVVAADEMTGWRRVRWACCGLEEMVKVGRLSVMRYREARGQVGQCRACDHAARRGEAAVAVDLPGSRKAWLPAGAMLPVGVLSAALAWPRPGARA